MLQELRELTKEGIKENARLAEVARLERIRQEEEAKRRKEAALQKLLDDIRKAARLTAKSGMSYMKFSLGRVSEVDQEMRDTVAKEFAELNPKINYSYDTGLHYSVRHGVEQEYFVELNW